MPSAVFRCDASPAIGGGHVVRCLTLADALAEAGWHCRFVCAAGSGDVVPALVRSPHDYVEIPADDGESVTALAAAAGPCDVLIVDHYGLDATFERRCRAFASTVVAVDDLADRDHDADLVVDPTPGRTPDDWHARVPGDTHLLLGPDYALLRRRFAEQRPDALARRAAPATAARAFVGLGAVDGKTMTPVALHGLAATDVAAVDVVVGAGSRGIDAVGALAAELDLDVAVHVDPPDVAALMARADLAVGAAGGGAWERCCLGLASVVVVTADNQAATAAALADADAAVIAGDHAAVRAADIAAAVVMLEDAATRRRIAGNAAALCDGDGARRVAAAVSQLVEQPPVAATSAQS